MSKFVMIVFSGEERIPEAIRALRNMHGGGGIKLYAWTVVTRDPGLRDYREGLPGLRPSAETRLIL